MMGIFSKLTFVAFGYYFLKLEKLCYMGKKQFRQFSPKSFTYYHLEGVH